MLKAVRAVRVAALVGCILLAGSAMAQPSTGEEPTTVDEPTDGETTAKELFDLGLDDMLHERYERGCPALVKSNELEPLPGVLFTAAECNYRWGKLAAAQRYFEEFKDIFDAMSEQEQKQQQHRMDVAAKRLPDLEQRVPVVTLRLPPGAPDGTVVIHEGKPVPSDSLGTPKAFEPGRHTFVVRHPNGQELERGALLQEGDRRTIILDMPAPGATAEPTPTTDPQEPASADADEPFVFPMSGDTMRLTAYIAGGVGAASLVVGIVTGAIVFSEKGTLEDHCEGLRCDSKGLDAADSAQTLAVVSTIGFVVGAVGLGAGTALWLLAPDDDADAVQVDAGVGPGGASLSFSARF